MPENFQTVSIGSLRSHIPIAQAYKTGAKRSLGVLRVILARCI